MGKISTRMESLKISDGDPIPLLVDVMCYMVNEACHILRTAVCQNEIQTTHISQGV